MAAEGDHANRLEHELTVCKDENRSLKRRNDELAACADTLTVERDLYLGQVNSLNEEIREAKAQRDEANEEKVTLKSDIERLRLWDVQKDHEIQLLKEQLQQQMEKLQTLGKENLENQQRLHDYQYSVVPKLESEKSRLEKQEGAIDAHNKWLAKEFESQKLAIDAERKQKTAFICELETKVGMHEQEISTTQSKLRRLEEERNKLDNDNDKLRKKLVDLQVASSNQDVIAKQEIGSSEHLISVQTAEIEQLKTRLKDTLGELELVRGEKDNLKNANEDGLCAMEKENRQLLQRAKNAERETVKVKGLLQRLDANQESPASPSRRRDVAAGARRSPPARATPSQSIAFMMSPTAAAVQDIRQRGHCSVAETYASYLEASDNIEQLAAENAKLKQELDSILRELEGKAPMIIANQREFCEIQKAFNKTCVDLEKVMEENAHVKAELAGTADLRSKCSHLEQENKDLCFQLRVVLAEQLPETFPTVHEKTLLDESHAFDVAMGRNLQPPTKSSICGPDFQPNIAPKEITFRDICELQERNRELMHKLRVQRTEYEKVRREAHQEAFGEVRVRFQKAQAEVEKLTLDMKQQYEVVDSLMRQRDRLFGVLLSQPGFTVEDIAPLCDPDQVSEYLQAIKTGEYHPTRSLPSHAVSKQRRVCDSLRHDLATKTKELQALRASEISNKAITEGEIERGNIRIRQLQDQEDCLRRKVEELEEEVKQLRDSNAALISNSHKTLAKLDNALVDKTSAEQELAVARAQFAPQKEHIADLTRQLDEQRQKVSQQAMNAQLLAAVGEIQASLQLREKEQEKAESQRATARQESELVRRDLEAERIKCRKAEQKYEELRAEAEKQRQQKDARIEELSKGIAQLQQAQDTMSERYKKVHTTELQLKQAQQELQQAEQQLAEATKQVAEKEQLLDAKTKETQDLQEKIQAQAADMAELGTQQAQSAQQSRDATDAAQKLKGEKDLLSRELDQSKAEAARLQQALQQSKTNEATLKKQLAEALAQQQKARAQADEAQAQSQVRIDELSTKCESHVKQNAQNEHAWAAEKGRLMSQVAELQSKYDCAVNLAVKEKTGLAAEKAKMSGQLQTSNDQLAQMRSALDATEAAKAALQKQVGDLQEQLGKVQLLKAQDDEEKKRLTASVQELKGQKETKEQEVADLQRQLVGSTCGKLEAMQQEVKQDVWAPPPEETAMQASAVDSAQDAADADTLEGSDKKRCQQQAEDEEAQRPAKRVKVDADTEADKEPFAEAEPPVPPEGADDASPAAVPMDALDAAEGTAPAPSDSVPSEDAPLMSVDAAESVDGSVSQDTPMAGPVPDAPGAAALQGPDQGVAVDQAVLVQSSQESLFTFTAPTTDSASDIASNPFGTFSFGGPPASLLSAEPGDPLSDTAATAPSDEPAAASLEGTAEPALAQEAVRDDQEQGQDQAQQPRQRPRRRWAKPVSPVSSATSAFASSSAPTSAPSDATSREDSLKQQLALLLKKQPDTADVKEEPSTVALSVGNILHVEVCEANGLRAADPWGTSDPYCKVTLGSNTQSTSVKTKTLSPQWNQSFTFPMEDVTVTTVAFQLWDSDLRSSDDLLGECSYDISALLLGIASEVTLPVSMQYNRDEMVNSGQLKVVLKIVQP